MRVARSNLPLRDLWSDKTQHDVDGFEPGGSIRVAFGQVGLERALMDSAFWVSGAKGATAAGHHMLDE